MATTSPCERSAIVSKPTHTEKKDVLSSTHTLPNHCTQCGSPPNRHTMRNFDPRDRTADLYCIDCGAYVREWDPS